MESRLRRTVALLTLALAACQGGGKPSTALEPRSLDPRDVEVLDRLSKLWVASPAEYRGEKLQLLVQKPELAPWLVKSLTAEAVKTFDHLDAQGVVVRDLLASPQGGDSFFGRTRQELATFGPVGLESVFAYSCATSGPSCARSASSCSRPSPPTSCTRPWRPSGPPTTPARGARSSSSAPSAPRTRARSC
ncbi:MAG: hypothetical protein R3F30_02940 [Planctomycetota bacterium]